jgi:hypothetical protein
MKTDASTTQHPELGGSLILRMVWVEGSGGSVDGHLNATLSKPGTADIRYQGSSEFREPVRRCAAEGGWTRVMQGCEWRVAGSPCGQVSEGLGVRFSVTYAPAAPEGRWLPLCERHARFLGDGFTISTDAGTIDVRPSG